jgi:hypothetical protein
MIYVFDTSSLIILKHYYPDRFGTLWSGLGRLVDAGDLISTREVLNELQAYNDVDFIQDWAKLNKRIFMTPGNNELDFVAQIFTVKHFHTLIGTAELLKGKPVADPFVIAAAQVRNGKVVTQEKAKPNSAKIPTVCHHFSVPCINLEDFMSEQNWTF